MTDNDGSSARSAPPRTPGTISRPADEQVVYRSAEHQDVVGASRPRSLDVPATLAGALAALGTFALLSSLVGAVGSIGFQRGVDGQDLSIAGLVAGLVVLFLSCLVGGWVAGRIARRRGALHGLLAAVWLVVLAALLTALAAVGDKADVRDQVGLPDWFRSDATSAAAIITGVIALALMLLGGWLGGRLGQRSHDSDTVEVVQTRREVRRHDGGITAEEAR
ncbi:YrzE family protein [Nocardioides sp. W7]|uniref:YrzE family protein n=1 Tax=Nocardioides sp. W7 TaxID=2931390 RepID=UPI001FD23DF0|nr:YrzE family protein [Nocardioides sp. W7]